MRRSERFGWLLLAVFCGALLSLAAGILMWDYQGDRRVQECREHEVQGSDGWHQCTSRGDFFG